MWFALLQTYGLRAWGSLLLRLVVAIVIIEGGTRILFAVKGYLDRDLPLCYDYVTVRCRTPEYYAELNDVIRYESVVGIGHTPNYRGQWINTNGQGFRGVLDYGEKTPGTLRIVMMGGSAVWGPFVHDDETIAAYLSKELEVRLGQPVEVINAGVTAERSSEEIRRLLAYILPLTPDIVVVYDGRNDLYFSASPNWNSTITPAVQNHEALERQKQDAALGGLLDQVWQTGVAYSKFLSAVDLLYQAWDASRASQLQPRPAGEKGETILDARIEKQALADYEKNLRRMALLLKSENILPIFVLQAILHSEAKPLSPEEEVILSRIPASVQQVIRLYPQAQDIFTTLSRDDSIVVLDYANVFADTPEQVYFDDVHYMPLGNEIIARHLANDIVIALENRGIHYAVRP